MARELNAEVRTKVGRHAAYHVRCEDKIPAVIYRSGEVGTNLAIPANEWKKLLASGQRVVTLKMADGDRQALIKAVQYDPLGEDTIHVDFNELREGETVRVAVAIVLKGVPIGHNDGGALNHAMHVLHVECLPTQIPEKIVIDVEPMKVDDVIHVRDVKLPDGVKAADHGDWVICAVHTPRAESEPEEGAPTEPEVLTAKKEDPAAAAAPAKKDEKEEVITMKLIVGLGNPGREYAMTRHNVGFRVLDAICGKIGTSFDRSKFKGDYAEGVWSAPKSLERLLLVKPLTYMNLSGETVASFKGYYKIELSDVLVISDDVSLPVGALRIRRGGSDGGHNGLKSITQMLGGQDYARLRVGVGGREHGAERPPADLAGHVLSRFSKEEDEILAKGLARAVDACLEWVGNGVEVTMNKFNTEAKTKSEAKQKSTDPRPAGRLERL